MTVTFNDVVLADGEARTMRVASGLSPSGDVAVDVLTFLRAAWAEPVARHNRLITLPVFIEFPACESFEEALVESLMYFANLPTEGVLVIAHGDKSVTFTLAVCASCKQLEEIEGLSNGVQLTFVCGEPANATLSLLAQMPANVVNFLPLTGRTGGAGKLDGPLMVTADVAVGRYLTFVNEDVDPHGPEDWQLITDPDPGVTVTNAEAGIILAVDHDPATNPKIWIRRR